MIIYQKVTNNIVCFNC